MFLGPRPLEPALLFFQRCLFRQFCFALLDISAQFPGFGSVIFWWGVSGAIQVSGRLVVPRGGSGGAWSWRGVGRAAGERQGPFGGLIVAGKNEACAPLGHV